MCPQLYRSYRENEPDTLQPELQIRGAARRPQMLEGVDGLSSDSEEDPPPPLEPAMPIGGRTPAMTPDTFTIYRAQGTSTRTTTLGVDRGLVPGRQSRMSRWSSSGSDDEPRRTIQRGPPYNRSRARRARRNVTRLEQYLVLVVDGERLFFRMTIVIERGSRGFRPTVTVDFMNDVPGQRTVNTEVWLLFAGQLESILSAEVDRAFREAGASREDSF